MFKSTGLIIPRSLHFLLTVTVQVICASASPINPDQMRKECGEISCTRHEYCTSFDHVCHPCDLICNNESNNYDSNRCNVDCQDYLHDQTYLRNDDMKIESELWTLKLLVAVTLAMTALTLTVLFIIFFMKLKRWKYHKKRNSATIPSVIYNNNQREKPLPMRAGARAAAAHPQSVQRKNEANSNSRESTLGSLSSSREPRESSLPEYPHSYDNPALAPSPTNHI